MIRAVIGSLLVWCAFSAVAQAQTRVVVFEFEGKDADQLRTKVVDMLEEHAIEVVSPKVANAQARRSGAELDTESGRVRVGKKLRLNSFMEGRVERTRRAIRVHLTVYAARDGLVAGEMNLSAPKKQLVSEVEATFWEQLGPAIKGETAPVNEPEPQPIAEVEPVQGREALPPPVRQAQAEPNEPPPDAITAEEPEESAQVAANALDINLGARFGTRSFAYNEPLPGLRPYHMRVSPNLRLQVRWFPVAHFSDGVMSNIGLDLRGELLVGVTSENRAGQKFATDAYSFGVGVRGRLPFRTLELGALLGYGLHSFSFEGTSTADPEVPDAGYGFLRMGLDLRWAFYEPLYFAMQAAYLLGIAHGEIESRQWFPHTRGDGVEAELAFGASISKALAIEAAFALQRYFMSFDPQPRDPGVRGPGRVAGGAVDQYVSGRVAMVIRL